MDNMKDKFAQFSVISIMLVSASMTLFTRLVDGYYELKNVLSIIITLYICINLVIVIYLYCKDQNREVKEQEERLDNREKELKEKESKSIKVYLMKLEIFVINWKKIPIQTQLTVCIPRWNNTLQLFDHDFPRIQFMIFF